MPAEKRIVIDEMQRHELEAMMKRGRESAEAKKLASGFLGGESGPMRCIWTIIALVALVWGVCFYLMMRVPVAASLV